MMKSLTSKLLAATLLAVAPAALAAAPAETPAVKVGMKVVDTANAEVGMIVARNDTTVTLKTDAHEIPLSTSSFTVQGARVAEQGPVERILTHAPGAPLIVRYRIGTAYDHDPAVGEDDHTYRPILRPSWFSVLGVATLADVEDRQGGPAELRFGPLPKGWGAASSAEPKA